MNMPQMRYYFP